MEQCLKLKHFGAFWWIMDMEIGAELMLCQRDDVCQPEIAFIFRGNLTGSAKSFDLTELYTDNARRELSTH